MDKQDDQKGKEREAKATRRLEAVRALMVDRLRVALAKAGTVLEAQLVGLRFEDEVPKVAWGAGVTELFIQGDPGRAEAERMARAAAGSGCAELAGLGIGGSDQKVDFSVLMWEGKGQLDSAPGGDPMRVVVLSFFGDGWDASLILQVHSVDGTPARLSEVGWAMVDSGQGGRGPKFLH